MPHQEDSDPSDCDRLDEWREWRDARRDSLRDKRDGWREKPRDCLTLPVRAVADRRNDPATLMNTEEIADADLESADITDDFDICLLFDNSDAVCSPDPVSSSDSVEKDSLSSSDPELSDSSLPDDDRRVVVRARRDIPRDSPRESPRDNPRENPSLRALVRNSSAAATATLKIAKATTALKSPIPDVCRDACADFFSRGPALCGAFGYQSLGTFP